MDPEAINSHLGDCNVLVRLGEALSLQSLPLVHFSTFARPDTQFGSALRSRLDELAEWIRSGRARAAMLRSLANKLDKPGKSKN